MRHHAHNCAGGDGRASQGREKGGAARKAVRMSLQEQWACRVEFDLIGYEISRRYLGVMLWRWVKSQ